MKFLFHYIISRLFRPAKDGKSQQWRMLRVMMIPNYDPDYTGSDDYLVRWIIIGTPYFSIYLHKIATPDSRPVLHDHPWTFVSFILRGGYDEVRLNKHTLNQYAKSVRFLNIMRRDDAHFIQRLHKGPAWTLVFTGRRRRTWGYWRRLPEIYNPSSRYSYSKPNSPQIARQSWYWTPFDRDVNAELYNRVMAERQEKK